MPVLGSWTTFSDRVVRGAWLVGRCSPVPHDLGVRALNRKVHLDGSKVVAPLVWLFLMALLMWRKTLATKQRYHLPSWAHHASPQDLAHHLAASNLANCVSGASLNAYHDGFEYLPRLQGLTKVPRRPRWSRGCMGPDAGRISRQVLSA